MSEAEARAIVTKWKARCEPGAVDGAWTPDEIDLENLVLDIELALQARDARIAELEEYAKQGWVAAHAARDAVRRCDALAERLRRAEEERDSIAEALFSLLEWRPGKDGKWTHHVICSGDRSKPPGHPGCVCLRPTPQDGSEDDKT